MERDLKITIKDCDLSAYEYLKKWYEEGQVEKKINYAGRIYDHEELNNLLEDKFMPIIEEYIIENFKKHKIRLERMLKKIVK